MKLVDFEGISLMGGRGTRFNPITSYMPKEFLPIIYKEHKEIYNSKNVGTEIVVCQLYQMENLGIKEKSIVINPQKIKYYEKNLKERWYQMSKNNSLVKKIVEIIENSNLIIQEEANGDADAIFLALNSSPKKYFLVYYGDVIYNNNNYKKDFKKAIDILLKEDYDIIFFTKFIEGDPSRFGVFKVKDNHVIDIVEKPKENLEYLISNHEGKKGFYINTGVLLIKKENILPMLAYERNSFLESKEENKELIMAKIVKKHLDNIKVGIYKLSEQEDFEDYGTYKDYIELSCKNLDLLKKY